MPGVSPLDEKWLLRRAVYTLIEQCQTVAIRLAELRCPPRLVGRPDGAIAAAGQAIADARYWASADRFLRELLGELHQFYQSARDGSGAISVAHDSAIFGLLAPDMRHLVNFAEAHPATQVGQKLAVAPGSLIGQLVPEGLPTTPSGALPMSVPPCPRRAYPEWARFVEPRLPREPMRWKPVRHLSTPQPRPARS